MLIYVGYIGVGYKAEVLHFAELNANTVVSLNIAVEVDYCFIVIIYRLRGSILKLYDYIPDI
jgi:hypothetical protein